MMLAPSALLALMRALVLAVILAGYGPGLAAAVLEVAPGTSINAAIASAQKGDTLLIAPGRYNEHVLVDKALTLQGRSHPTISGRGHGDTIRINREGLLQVDKLLHEFFLPEHRGDRYA